MFDGDFAAIHCWNSGVLVIEDPHLPAQIYFSPVFWAFNRHAQTVVCFVLCHLEWLWAPQLEWKRESVRGFDDNPQFLDWAHFPDQRVRGRRAKQLERARGRGGTQSSKQGDDAPIVLLVHGLGDSRHHPYCKRWARLGKQCGWRTVVFSYWRADFAETRDLQACVDHIAATHPRAPIVGIGYSAGAHILMRYARSSSSSSSSRHSSRSSSSRRFLSLFRFCRRFHFLRVCVDRYVQAEGKRTPLVAAITVGGCFDFTQAAKDVKANENASYNMFLDLQLQVRPTRGANQKQSGPSLRAPSFSSAASLTLFHYASLFLSDRGATTHER